MKWDGYRALAHVVGGEATLTSRRGNDLTERFADVARALERACARPTASSTARSVRSTRRAARASASCSRARGRSSTTSSTSSRSTGSRCSTSRSTSGASACARLLDLRGTRVRLSETFEDGRALYDAAKAQGLEGVLAKKKGVALPAGQAHARLAQGEDPPGAGVRRRRLHEGQGRRAGRLGSLVLAVMRGRRARLRRATSARASPRTRSSGS